MKRLRILLLITNLGQGGAQRVFFDQAKSLAAYHQIEEAVFDVKSGDRIYDSGLPLHQLDGGLLGFGPIGRLVGRALALRQLVKRRRYDMVISHMDGANWINILSGAETKKILVVHGTVMHDQTVSKFVQLLRRTLIFPFLYNFASCTVAVSDGIAHELERDCGVRNVVALPNSFEVEDIDKAAQVPIPTRLKAAFEHPLVLITSGRLAKQKNQANLLGILYGLLAIGHRTRLVILGDGELRLDLVKQAKELKLRVFDVWSHPFDAYPTAANDDYDVWFLGYVDNPFAYLSRGCIFVFPSAWEGYPLALCEAMICRTPVISADCPTGPREILAPGEDDIVFGSEGFHVGSSGILAPIPVNADTRSAWINAIVHLGNDHTLRMRLIERARIEGESMDRKKGLSRWLSLIEEVAKS